MDVCSDFTPDRWRPNKCCQCFHLKEKHLINPTTETSSSLDTDLLNKQRAVLYSNNLPLPSVCPENPADEGTSRGVPSRFDSFISHSSEHIEIVKNPKRIWVPTASFKSYDGFTEFWTYPMYLLKK